MAWPFKRHRGEQERLSQPRDIPIYNTKHEEVIEAFLERAHEYAQTLPKGEMFAITLPEQQRAGIHEPIELMGPIMMRAYNKGLSAKFCRDWEFTFVYNGEPDLDNEHEEHGV